MFTKRNVENEMFDEVTDNEVWIMKNGELVKLEVLNDDDNATKVIEKVSKKEGEHNASYD